MGFKLIPICDDGVTPNVSGLLTPEERESSIRESKTGKEELVNYIYHHPEFWNEDRIEKEAYRFKSVATTYGKTHLKDAENRDLYLYELDLDDKEIFTRLSIININGKNHYFLDEIGKITFGVKTRKEWGRRYYWLSHKQERPIRSNHCKIGHSFELKSDNSTGHGTLPPSRYRNDPSKHYQFIGIDKIAMQDAMYDGLLKILDDCLINKKNGQSNPHRADQKKNNAAEQRTRFDLVEEDAEELLNEILNYYSEGFRHNIIYGLSALLFKRNISLTSSEYLIANLCDNTDDPDFEKNDRLTLRTTYEKGAAGQPLEGYSSLIKTFVSISGEGKAQETMKCLLGILNKYGNPVLNQLDVNVRKELSNHVFEIMSYSPLTFVIAHHNNKQILHGRIYYSNGDGENQNENIQSNNTMTISQSTSTQYVRYDSVIINVIPTKILKYEDPTNIETKYEVDFETSLGNIVHIEPKSKKLKEIQEELKLNGLVYKIRAAEEALPAILRISKRWKSYCKKRSRDTWFLSC